MCGRDTELERNNRNTFLFPIIWATILFASMARKCPEWTREEDEDSSDSRDSHTFNRKSGSIKIPLLQHILWNF